MGLAPSCSNSKLRRTRLAPSWRISKLSILPTQVCRLPFPLPPKTPSIHPPCLVPNRRGSFARALKNVVHIAYTDGFGSGSVVTFKGRWFVIAVGHCVLVKTDNKIEARPGLRLHVESGPLQWNNIIHHKDLDPKVDSFLDHDEVLIEIDNQATSLVPFPLATEHDLLSMQLQGVGTQVNRQESKEGKFESVVVEGRVTRMTRGAPVAFMECRSMYHGLSGTALIADGCCVAVVKGVQSFFDSARSNGPLRDVRSMGYAWIDMLDQARYEPPSTKIIPASLFSTLLERDGKIIKFSSAFQAQPGGKQGAPPSRADTDWRQNNRGGRCANDIY